MERSIYDIKLIDSKFVGNHYKYFVLAPNIEKRSIAAYKSILGFNRIDNIIAANYESFHINTTEEQEKYLLSCLPAEKLISLNAKTDSDFLSRFSEIGINSDCSIAVDITGFSIPTIYKIMELLHNQLNINRIEVFYTEPKHYIYKEAYFDSYHMKTENRPCLPIPGFFNSGDAQDEVLTIFLGFDQGLAFLVYNKLTEEGSVPTIAVNGFPSYTPKLKDISLYNNQSLITQLQDEDVMTVTANNPFDTFNLLCRIRKQYPKVLLNICTIGCKPMALGACLFALNFPENVKVTYPQYQKTRFDADEEVGKTWRYVVSFS